jgi:L-fucose isomerase-like protein
VALGTKILKVRQIAKEIGDHHLAMTYGNWSEEIKMLSELLNIKAHIL